MRRLFWLILLLVFPVTAMAEPPDSIDVRLEAHRWEHRLLFVFTPSASDSQFAAQRAALRGTADGFRDRDLLLLTLTGDAGSGTVQSAPGAEAHPLTAAAVRRIRARFSVGAGAFRVLLVGKDGTEKRREATPVTARSLFDTIDAMPMRQREMRESDGP